MFMLLNSLQSYKDLYKLKLCDTSGASGLIFTEYGQPYKYMSNMRN